MITGAEMVIKALIAENVNTLFAYPGGQAIDLFHALYGQRNIDLILPRHEQGLIHAADGYARSTGKVGVCLVTSGPGATNLVTGIPVITTIMGKGAIPTTHHLYVGNIGIHGSYAANTAISQCDVLFSIGTRFNDRITGKIEQFAAQAVLFTLI